MSVGSMSAIGGSFVPVSDNGVTLNSGYLVYKTCVLSPAAAQMKNYLTAAYMSAWLQTFNTSRNGNPSYSQSIPREMADVRDRAFSDNFYVVTSALNPAIQNPVQVALARNFAMQTQRPQMSLACPTATGYWDNLFARANPSCNPVFAYFQAENELGARVASAQNDTMTQLNWGRGTYPVTDENGLVVTPAFLVAELAAQNVTSGYRQLEMANDIGQMTSALFASMGNRLLSGNVGGLASISSPTGSQPSYLAQLTQEASQGLAKTLTNVALTSLLPSLAVEKAYNDAQLSIAQSLDNGLTQLRNAENKCWQIIVSRICSASSTPATAASGTTCTSTTGATLHIATSTAYSQPLIDSRIKPLALLVAKNVETSNLAIDAIKALIANVQNTSASGVQRAALQQYDTLVAQGSLHKQPDLDKANEDVASIQEALTSQSIGLVPLTLHAWAGDDTTNNVPGAVAWDGTSQNGWCNASLSTPGGPTTIDRWIAKWSAVTS